MRTERWRLGFLKGGAVVGLAVMAGVSGCKSNQAANTPAPIVDANGGPDPAAVNNAPAPVSGGTNFETPAAAHARQRARVLGQQASPPPMTASGEQYPEQGQGQPYPAGGNGANGHGTDGDYDAAYEQQINAGQDALYANQPPPPLPVYQQPELTEPGDQWTPGYWSYASQGYYWVPGAWVAPPFIGALWTPGYWGSYGGRYRFNHGYWGRHIGFYGGVPYGFGYTGRGYEGGYWNGNRFFYNNAVNRVNVNTVRNVYARNVSEGNNNRVSYNGPGGWNARPTASEAAVLHEQRVPAMQVQRQRAQEAAGNRQQFAGENQGRPAMAVLGQRQPADRVAPAALAPVGRPEGAQTGSVQLGGYGPVDRAANRISQEQERGQGGYGGARGGEAQPGNSVRPGVEEQMRQNNQQQQAPRARPELQPRTDPFPNQQQAPSQNRQRLDQSRELRTMPRQDERRQYPEQRPAQNPAQTYRPEGQSQPVARPQGQPRSQPQVAPRTEPAPHPEESHPHR